VRLTTHAAPSPERRRAGPLATWGGGLLGPFGVPGFAGLWTSAAAGSFARTVVQLALSWTTLEATGSPFLVGVVLAVRMLPLLVLGIPAGVVADAFDRRVLVAATSGGTVLVALAAAAAGLAGRLDLTAILVVTIVAGVLDTLRTAATQAYAYDLVREAHATRGIALTNFGAQLLGTLGGIAGGLALERTGPPGAFLIVALAGLAGALGPTLAPRDAATHEGASRKRPDFLQTVRLLGRNRLVAALALEIILAEVFGFSHQTLLPTFARDVFDVGATGLGEMTAARSLGGVLSLLLLARLGAGDHGGRIFLAAGAILGLSLVAFAVNPSYILALILLAIAGAAASASDALGQTLLQRSAPDRERGAAMGIWVFSIGFAPVGHLAVGAGADLIGASPAQLVSGAILVLIVAALALHAPLRRAR
jgi:MFS family permease